MRPDSGLAIEALRAQIAAENRERDQRFSAKIAEMEDRFRGPFTLSGQLISVPAPAMDQSWLG